MADAGTQASGEREPRMDADERGYDRPDVSPFRPICVYLRSSAVASDVAVPEVRYGATGAPGASIPRRSRSVPSAR